MHAPDTTIVALSTPPGRGAIALVRLSGPGALACARAVFEPRGNALIEPARARLGAIRARDRSEPIDTGYLTYFPSGRSYTGEEVVELSCHGSPVVVERILSELMAAGAVAASPGEFTYRAVLSGRLDLAQAEGIRDLIEAATPAAARVAAGQARGDLSRRVESLRDELVEVISRAEARIEFAEEPDVAAGPGDLADGVDRLAGDLDRLLLGYRTGRLLRDGARVVLAGRPNAGKSSLFNRLLGQERAIVAPDPGTTRDFISERIDLQGIPVTLVDTAGLRDDVEGVEREGVARARGWLDRADLILLLCSCEDEPDAADRATLHGAGERGLLVASKSDLLNGSFPSWTREARAVSSATGDGVASLRETIFRSLARADRLSSDETLVTDARHHEALRSCRDALVRARGAIADGMSEEVPLADLYDALERLGEITGRVTREAIYDRIFSTFCIGK